MDLPHIIPKSEKPEDHTRVKRLNSLVQHEVSAIIAREFEFAPGTLVTVSKVTVADDAENARVWLSVLPESASEAVLDMTKARIMEVQRMLNKKLVMKFVPKLTFVIDRQNEKADHITHVLDSINDFPREA